MKALTAANADRELLMKKTLTEIIRYLHCVINILAVLRYVSIKD